MKRQQAASATSLPIAPGEEADNRARHYLITMGIRTACFILMAVLQPMGWWTWVLALGAVFLPYIAVVFANNPDPIDVTGIEDPQRQLEAPRSEPAVLDDKPSVIIIRESPPGGNES